MKGSPQTHLAPATLLHRHAHASFVCWSELIGNQLTIHSDLLKVKAVT